MILVTGASGRVGRHLVEALLKQKEKVRALVKSGPMPSQNVEVVRGDILDDETVKKAVDGADTIFHLAAIVDYHKAPKKLLYNVNVVGTKNLLKHSKANRFVYLSSTAVYGSRPKNPADENTRYKPYNYYGKTKVMAEKEVLKRGGIVVRAPVIYGPSFDEGLWTVFSRISKGRMPIIGSGRNRIQWIHIDDLIRALLLAKEKGRRGEVYLVAGKDVKTQEELFSLAASYLGVPPPRRHVSPLLALTLAHYEVFMAKLRNRKPRIEPDQVMKIITDRTFDISKAKKELGFKPIVGYTEGGRESVEDFKSLQ